MRQELDAYLEDLLEANKIPGCGLKVRKNGELIYDRCLGYAVVEERKPVTQHTIFRLASMTKLVTAVAVMVLEEQGKLSVEDDLLKFFPSWPREKKQVQVRHLLNHSSALGQSDVSNDYWSSRWTPNESLMEMMEHWGHMPFDCKVGESAAYSYAVNFDILGAIIEIVSGMPCGAFMKQAIFDPLGMQDTGFTVKAADRVRCSGVYNCEDGQLVRQWEQSPRFARITANRNRVYAASGLFGTLYDYDRFTAMLAGGGQLEGVRIIEEQTLRRMRTPRQITQLEPIPGCPWGLGFMIFEDGPRSGIYVPKDTYGWSGAFGTHMFVNEQTGLCATFMINMGDLAGSDSYISRQIERIIFNM